MALVVLRISRPLRSQRIGAVARRFPHSRSRWRLHLSAFVAAYFAVALAGSLGAVAVGSAHRGFERVNVSGYLTWCWIYAAVFLPLSYPLALLLQRMIHCLHYVPEKAKQPGAQPDGVQTAPDDSSKFTKGPPSVN